jgi:hypothetical protein
MKEAKWEVSGSSGGSKTLYSNVRSGKETATTWL